MGFVNIMDGLLDEASMESESGRLLRKLEHMDGILMDPRIDELGNCRAACQPLHPCPECWGVSNCPSRTARSENVIRIPGTL